MPASRAVVSVLLRALGDLLYTLKAGQRAAAGRPRPAAARRPPGNRSAPGRNAVYDDRHGRGHPCAKRPPQTSASAFLFPSIIAESGARSPTRYLACAPELP
jgi:hypothetical protein